MPAGLSAIEEFKYMAEHYARMAENFKPEE